MDYLIPQKVLLIDIKHVSIIHLLKCFILIKLIQIK